MQGLAVLLLLLFSVCSCEQLVLSQTASVTIPTPNDPDLDVSSFLVCGIVPNTTEFVVTWTSPNNGSFTQADIANSQALSSKYVIQNGRGIVSFPQGSILNIMRLSYLDSGNYTCSVMFTGGTNPGATGSADFELFLLVQLQSANSVVSSAEGGNPSFTCNMKGYIYPDSEFLWRRGDDIITDTEKYSIIYSEGNPETARNGETDLVNSRFCVLTIMGVEESDVGEYTCFVRGAEEAINNQLRIEQSSTDPVSTANTPDDTQDTPNTNVAATQGPNDTTAIVVGVVAGVAVLLLLGVAVATGVCVAVHLKKPAAPADPDPVPGVQSVADSHFIMSPSTAYGVSKPPQPPEVMTQNIAYSSVISADKQHHETSCDDYEIVD